MSPRSGEDCTLKFAAYIQKRRKRYLAQILGAFEEKIEPYLQDLPPGYLDDFKALVRMRLNALAVDGTDAHSCVLNGERINGVAQDIRDSLSYDGRRP